MAFFQCHSLRVDIYIAVEKNCMFYIKCPRSVVKISFLKIYVILGVSLHFSGVALHYSHD
jgi:hypothetical protein